MIELVRVLHSPDGGCPFCGQRLIVDGVVEHPVVRTAILIESFLRPCCYEAFMHLTEPEA